MMVFRLKRRAAVGLMVLAALIASGAVIASIWPGPSAGSEAVSAVEAVTDNNESLLPSEPADEFFAEYRLQRDRTRGKQVEMLREILNQASAEKDARQAASLRLVEIAADIEKEMKAENLIKSKGFEDCVVIIQPENTTVVVAAAGLNAEQEQELTKLVSRSTKNPEQEIAIIVRSTKY